MGVPIRSSEARVRLREARMRIKMCVRAGGEGESGSGRASVRGAELRGTRLLTGCDVRARGEDESHFLGRVCGGRR